ncbi:hypothetical protein YC2023_066182 [Brassica napus]
MNDDYRELVLRYGTRLRRHDDGVAPWRPCNQWAGDLTLGRKGTSLPAAIGSILRTSDRPSRNIDRVISGHLRSGKCRPSQTPHLTMSSARIDPPKRVLGLKEGVVTPPPIHGSFHKVGLESSSTGSSFPADSAKPVPFAVVSLDIGFPLSVPVLSWLFDARGKIPKEPFPVRPPADPRRSALAMLAAQSQSFSRSYGSILPTSLAYIVPSTRGCSPWRPDAVMSTTGRERHSVLRIFKGQQKCTGHHGEVLRLSRFQGGQAVKQKR